MYDIYIHVYITIIILIYVSNYYSKRNVRIRNLSMLTGEALPSTF